MQQKRYIENLLLACSEEKFGQDAIEHAIITGALVLTYNQPTDIHQVFDSHSACCEAPPLGELDHDNHAGVCRQCHCHASFSSRYDEFCEAWRAARTDLNSQSMDAMLPLMEEINRAVPLAQAA